MIKGKVLFSAWGGKGGVDDVVASLMTGLEKRGIHSDIIYHDPFNDFIGFNTEGTQYNSKFDHFLKRIDWEEYAIINLHSCNFTPTELRKLRNAAKHVPIIYHAHGLISHVAFVEDANKDPSLQIPIDDMKDLPKERKKELRKTYNGWDCCRQQEALLKEADYRIFLTHFTHDVMKFWYPHMADRERDQFIPNASNFYLFENDLQVSQRANEIKSAISAMGDSQIIMYSGRVIPPKGASDLARAFDRIKENYPNAKLMISGVFDPNYDVPGYKGKDGKSVISHYVRPEFQKDVFDLGWADDSRELAARIKAADVLAIPSYHETFSVAALEGMFMGTPVIMGDVDGSHEVYVRPQLAYGVVPGDVDKLVNHFNYLFQDPARAQKNARHVKRVVNQKYNDNMVIDSTIGMFNAALHKRYGLLMGNCLRRNDNVAAEKIHELMKDNLFGN